MCVFTSTNVVLVLICIWVNSWILSSVDGRAPPHDSWSGPTQWKSTNRNWKDKTTYVPFEQKFLSNMWLHRWLGLFLFQLHLSHLPGRSAGVITAWEEPVTVCLFVVCELQRRNTCGEDGGILERSWFRAPRNTLSEMSTLLLRRLRKKVFGTVEPLDLEG